MKTRSSSLTSAPGPEWRESGNPKVAVKSYRCVTTRIFHSRKAEGIGQCDHLIVEFGEPCPCPTMKLLSCEEKFYRLARRDLVEGRRGGPDTGPVKK
jgi:hypothetical protein